jgi:primosomal protein N' (replication factor Y)
LYAEVLVDLPARQVDRSFHYLVPARLQELIRVGSRVQVPFGHQKISGYVVGFSTPPRLDQIKEITAVLDQGPVFNAGQIALARWLASRYLCSSVSALQTVIGPRLAGAPLRVKGIWPVDAKKVPDFSRAPAQKKVWQVAVAQPGLTRQQLAATALVSVSAVDSLIAKKLLCSREDIKTRSPFSGTFKKESRPLVLTSQQEQVYGEIQSALQAGKKKTFLLYGVTGSGKTEVYCRSVQQALNLDRQAIVLVPEISLTPQIIGTFKGHFGERVAVLHSRLSDGERYDEWMRITKGEGKIVLGARSALFAPLDNPGLIIVDEEHEPSYKQEETPRYHARAVVQRLADEKGAVVIFGSATPSLETYYEACRGTYGLLRLDERIEKRPLPRVQLVDMREEMRRGNRGLFSRTLLVAIRNTLAKNKQVILFLNRRGYSTIVVCRECGVVLKCPRCEVSLTYHTNSRLICHYCNYNIPAPSLCPDCRGRNLGYFGAGTQKVEQEVKRLFGGAGILRLDSDTTSRKGSHQKILDAFQRGEANILIGTQMVAKGLDIPSVTLVGVVNADTSLYMPDFRASERTFQLLTQVAGRAGRSDSEGEAIIQTYSPGHYAVQAARKHDYEGFYTQEIENRRVLGYPPFSCLARFLLIGAHSNEVEKIGENLAEKIKKLSGQEEVQILGPAPAPLSRIRDYYRYHLILKSPRFDLLHNIAAEARAQFVYPASRMRVVIDIEPQNLM